LCRNEALFRWQFAAATGSNGGAYRIRLARNQDETVACLGYMAADISLGGHIAKGAWVVNWMVDPRQRNLGLGPLLMRDVTSQFDVVLNVGPNRDARNLLARMGWADFGELSRYVCVLDIEAASALTRNGKLDWPLPKTTLGAGELAEGTTVRLVERFCDDSTQLWDSIWGQNAAGTRRSAKYLNRRYADHPVFKYRLFELRHLGVLTGLMVYRVEAVEGVPVRVGRIVELVCQPDAANSLLRAVLRDAQSQGVAAIDFFCSSRHVAAHMSQQGFLSADESATAQLPTLFQPIDWRRQNISFMAYLRNMPGATEIHDWYVTKGDGDQDRPN
jgi:hypothetical protein